MLKYKVIKDFGSAKKGDVLVNSIDDPQVFTMEYSDGDSDNCTYYRSMSISDDIADLYVEEGYLEEVEDNKSTKVVDLIDNLVDQYDKDYKEVMDKYSEGKVPPCVKLEAETVYYNLTKVLNKIKEELINE